MNDNIVVSPVVQTLTVTQTVQSVTVASPGPQGPQGPQGPSGASTTLFYVYTQNTPASVWTITHNLGGHPTAVVLDSSGAQCEGTYSYTDNNTMVITFTSAFTGTAYII